jgi:hypothetical protein
MKMHLFDSWHLPHIAHSSVRSPGLKGDLLSIAAFIIGIPLVTLGCLYLFEIIFGWDIP